MGTSRAFSITVFTASLAMALAWGVSPAARARRAWSVMLWSGPGTEPSELVKLLWMATNWYSPHWA